MKNVLTLTDNELNECFNGTTSPELVREILEKAGVVLNTGLIDVDQFAQWFAHSIQDLIDADLTGDDWQAAWRVNFEWGNDIAKNINAYVSE
jgi:hypothetical protein